MRRIPIIVVLGVLAFSPLAVRAQESLSLSVTPPLFQIAVEPGDLWQSMIKVVNTNPHDLTVFAEVVAFEPQGEDGQGRFLPVIEEYGEASLANWITLRDTSLTIPPEQSKDLSFIVEVPQDASPGGHFAAILIGTRPPKDSAEPLAVRVSQVVTSLFFVRVGGDVVESGDIREFSVERSFNGTPEANFVVRFENEGNVHLQPQGDITIYNMWGKERGYIPINQKTNFGNVLPESIRKFEFTWKGESSLSDIGRYRATLTLGYGDDGKQFVSRTLYFYVVPVKATLITVGAFLAFLLFMTWAVKAYVRRAISLAGYEPSAAISRRKQVASSKKDIELSASRATRNLSAPIRAGVIDLRRNIEHTESSRERMIGIVSFIRSYRMFFASVVVVLIALIAGGAYLVDVLTSQKSYEITVEKSDGSITMSSEEVLHDRLSEGVPLESGGSKLEQPFTLTLVNASDVPGTAANFALRLEELGYRVDGISSDLDRIQERTVIVYDLSLEDVAVRLSAQLGNVPISAFSGDVIEDTASPPDIRIIVGQDQSQ